ncbi:MAG: hypothetical protein HRU20_00330 [Pseudomonadales bacterium]|nr:hypothetical protein [Pseudomonadales bacterium]
MKSLPLQPAQIIYQDTLFIDAPVDLVSHFITDAKFISAYYPAGFSYQNLSPKKYLACYGLFSASLLEVLTPQAKTPQRISMKVYNTLALMKKHQACAFKKKSFLTCLKTGNFRPAANKHVS